MHDLFLLFRSVYDPHTYVAWQYDRVRQIYQRFAQAHPVAKTWLKWAKFEEHTGDLPRARLVYETAFQFLGEENADEKLFIEFAKFEERSKEFDRARGIYKFALDHVPKHLAQVRTLRHLYSLRPWQLGLFSL